MGDSSRKPALRIKNEKTTNGRAHGKYRIFMLNIELEQLSDLHDFLKSFKRHVAEIGASVFQQRLRKRLKQACQTAGIAVLSPYTLRHVGMAHAKTVLTDLEVSYAAGHYSSRTKHVHYARKRKSKASWVSPDQAFSLDPVDVSLVRDVKPATEQVEQEFEPEFEQDFEPETEPEIAQETEPEIELESEPANRFKP